MKGQITYEDNVYWNSQSYGKVFKVTPTFIGFILDRIIPMTFILLQTVFTLIGKKLKINELFRITIHNKENII